MIAISLGAGLIFDSIGITAVFVAAGLITLALLAPVVLLLRGTQPDALARDYVHASLPIEAEPHDEVVRRTLAALEQLRKRRADLRQRGYPAVDAVDVAHESRRELEEQQDFLWRS